MPAYVFRKRNLFETKENSLHFFLIEIYETMKSCKDKTFLRIAILGSAFFLFVGAFFQLNVIPFAIESLGLSEVGGGYLFLTTAIGIAIGASVAGRASKEKIELGLSCVALCFLALLTFILAIFNFSLVVVLAALVTIGFACGLFLVPLDSFIQTNSPEKQRGQIIAATNFLELYRSAACSFLPLFFWEGVLQIKAWMGFFYHCLRHL